MVSSSCTMVSGSDVHVGEGGSHSGEEHSITGRAGHLSVGGVVVDAVRGDDLVEEIEFTCVDGFSELAKCGLCGFFAHNATHRCFVVESRRFGGTPQA